MENLDIINSISPAKGKIAAETENRIIRNDKEKFCKDFESIFIVRLLDEMKNTIGDWGLEQDEASKQTQSLFWMYLAQDMGDKGGFGLWKQIYKQLSAVDSPAEQPQNLEVEI
jgi:Rod binding domain-containing protein